MRIYREERYIHTRDKVLETVGAPQAHSPCHGDGFGGPHCMEWTVCRYFTRHMWPTSHLVPLCARVLNAPPRLTHHHPRPSFITDSLAAL